MMDKKPRAKLKTELQSTPDSKPAAKKKRKSPAVPWKKPKDMPKRPLSAYNIFFKDEREKLIAERKRLKELAEAEAKACKEAGQPKPARGIGFANLAKTIAAKWNTLDPETRAPYEAHAAKEKARYDVAVAKWREQQKEKAAKLESERKEAEELRSPSTPSDKSSLESFSIKSGSYPSQWFQSGSESGTVGERSGIPSVVDASMLTDESSRTLASSLTGETSPQMQSWHSGAASMRAETHFPMMGQPSPYMGYGGHEFGVYEGSDAPQHRQQGSLGAAGAHPSMRSSARPAGIESDMERIQGHVEELRRARESAFEASPEAQYHAPSQASRAASLPAAASLRSLQPRNSSLPSLLPQPQISASTPRPMPLLESQGTHGFAPVEARNYAWNPGNTSNIPHPPTLHRMSLPPRPLDIPVQRRREQHYPQRAQPGAPDEELFDDSMRSLSENLDDDAIDFLTSMRFDQA